MTHNRFKTFVYFSASNFKAIYEGTGHRDSYDSATWSCQERDVNSRMTVECRDIKKLKEVQVMFVKETGVSSWSEAEKEFPAFATPEALDEFKKCPIKSMPQR